MMPAKFKSLMLLLLVGLFLIGCQNEPANVSVPGVELENVDIADVVQPAPTVGNRVANVTIVADGSLKVTEPVYPLSFVVSGRLLTLNVAAGDLIEAGDLIATVDDLALRNAVANAEVNLTVAQASLAAAQIPATAGQIASAEAQVAIAEAGIVSAQASLDRLFVPLDYASIIEADARVVDAELALQSAINGHEQLILNEILGAPEEAARQQVAAAQINLDAARARANQSRRGPTEADIEGAEAAIAQAEANLASAAASLDQLLAPIPTEQTAVAEAQIVQAELALSQTQQALVDVELYAPFGGTIIEVPMAVGLQVGPGTPIVTIQNRSLMEFQTTNLSERDLGQIETGLDVEVILKSFPQERIPGTVVRIGRQADGIIGDSATFPIIIVLDAGDIELREGMTGRVEISPP